ncbi:MAG: FkbM family methyltransferase [Flavobacterium sp.]|uniref:FkbM family methyltransferase n=1 Tax=Flavobacterium sp. TaxID=239 RepID=UPI003267D248
MRQIIAKFLLLIYNNVKRSNLLRNLIKGLIGDRKFVFDFNGLKICASPNSAIESNIIFNSYNEVIILKLIENYAAKGYNFIDIGANIGLHSISAAKSNPNIEIFSFEPETNNFNCFIRNIDLNDIGNIRPFKMGLGNFKGTISMNINQDWNKGRHSLKVSFGENTKKLNIPLTRLDDFKEYINCENLLLKIDVEGFEKEVIEGGEKIIGEIKQGAIIIELLEEINGLDVCKSIVETLKASEFDAIYKIHANQFISVKEFEGSADYILVKGNDSQNLFNNFNKKCEKV